MKKMVTIMGAALFVLGFGVAYAGAMNNGVTDFSGRTYDVLEISPAASIEHNAFEGASAGGIRLAAIDTEQIHNGVTDFSGRTYDVLGNAAPSAESVAEGSAAGGPRRNLAGEESGVRTFDSLPLAW